MTHNIIISGFGGQGILFMGKVLAYAAMLTGKHLSWLPSYGPEMRGGTANCHVIISDEPIGSPIVTEPDILITMNKPSLDKFEPAVIKEGAIFVDSSLIDREVSRTDVKTYYTEATKTAMELGNSALANMVLLGTVVRKTGIFLIDEIRDGLDKAVPKSKAQMLDINMNAVMAGYNS